MDVITGGPTTDEWDAPTTIPVFKVCTYQPPQH